MRADRERLEMAIEDAKDLQNQMAPKKGQGKYKDGNPKTAYGIKKPGNFYTPTIPYLEYSIAHMQGAFKYGPFNWRDDPVSISTYIEAAERHIALYKDGQRNASDTGIHHLAHAMCCFSIVIDAEAHNTLIDDRFKPRDPERHPLIDRVTELYIEATEARVKQVYNNWFGYKERMEKK